MSQSLGIASDPFPAHIFWEEKSQKDNGYPDSYRGGLNSNRIASRNRLGKGKIEFEKS